GAVAERMVRLQPNLSSVTRIPLIDGYEEGLLPVRTFANLQRRYNRNLRTDSPDASLLAFLGSNLMLTEFPLPTGPDWQSASPQYTRPAFVPSTVQEALAVHQYWKSIYPSAIALDGSVLASHLNIQHFLQQCKSAFPLQQLTREPTQVEKM